MSERGRKPAIEAAFSFGLMLTSSLTPLGGTAFWARLALAQALVAVALGIVALVRIRRRSADLRGLGLAVGGILGSAASGTLGVPALLSLPIVLLIAWYLRDGESEGLFSHAQAPESRLLLLASMLVGANYVSVASGAAMFTGAIWGVHWIFLIPSWVALSPLGVLSGSLGLSAVLSVWRRKEEYSETTVLLNLGLATSIVGILIMIVFMFPALFRELEAGRKSICLSNERRLLEAVLETGVDASPAWCEGVGAGGDGSAFACPSAPHSSCGYALNSGVSVAESAEQEETPSLVLLFESDAGWNAVGGPALLPDEPRHRGGDNYGFADGHVQWLPRRKNPDGTWAKEPEADWVMWEPVLREGEGEVSEAEEDA